MITILYLINHQGSSQAMERGLPLRIFIDVLLTFIGMAYFGCDGCI
jgi:hypothetical protein